MTTSVKLRLGWIRGGNDHTRDAQVGEGDGTSTAARGNDPGAAFHSNRSQRVALPNEAIWGLGCPQQSLTARATLTSLPYHPTAFPVLLLRIHTTYIPGLVWVPCYFRASYSGRSAANCLPLPSSGCAGFLNNWF